MKILWSVLHFPALLMNRIDIKRKRVQCGKNVVFHGKVGFHGNGVIQLGDDVVITSSTSYNPSSGASQTHLTAGVKAILRIGNNSGISNTAITASEKVLIGENVMIGSGCMITDTDFHSIEFENRMQHPDTHVKTAPVTIEDGVFIGARSIILKGVSIGAHSVIGAGSVVTKNVPANEIWAGNPAHFVKKLEP